MTDTEIIRLWKWSNRDMRQVMALAQLSQRKILDVLHLLNAHGLTKEGWKNGKKGSATAVLPRRQGFMPRV